MPLFDPTTSSCPSLQSQIERMEIVQRPHEVEFRQATGFGIRVVLVNFATREPKIKAYTETLGTDRIEFNPMFLSLSEIEEYIVNARHKSGRND